MLILPYILNYSKREALTSANFSKRAREQSKQRKNTE